jgi:hypothetical protein
VKPVIVDGDGKILEGAAEGNLCIADSWPGMMRTFYGDHKRVETYFSTFPGKYFTGDGARRDVDDHQRFGPSSRPPRSRVRWSPTPKSLRQRSSATRTTSRAKASTPL